MIIAGDFYKWLKIFKVVFNQPNEGPYLPLAGGTMTGNLTLNGAPTTDLMAATKLYVDLAVSGISPAGSVLAATTENLVATYDNGSSGIGATLTITATGTVTFDDVLTIQDGEYLIKNQTDSTQNGIYTVTTAGSVGVSQIFTRSTTFDTPAQINSSGIVPVLYGTANAETGWYPAGGVTTIGTDPIVFVKFGISIPVTISEGGTGLTSLPTVWTEDSYAAWDSEGKLTARTMIPDLETVATNDLELNSSSGQIQYRDRPAASIVKVPSVGTLRKGQGYFIINGSDTYDVTVNANDDTLIKVVAPLCSIIVTCQNPASGTEEGGWAPTYIPSALTSGVTSITGTADQVIASSATGDVTLSLPQSIATTSSPTFSTLTLNGLTASQVVATNASKILTSIAYASINTASALIQRDSGGNFTAGTATLSNITMSNSSAIRTTAVPGNFFIQAYDVNDLVYRTFVTITSNVVPSMAFVCPTGGSLTVDGAVIGATDQRNAQFLSPVNTQTGTSYTLAISDCSRTVTLDNASPITLTLPQQSSVAIVQSFFCNVVNIGAGTVTIVVEGAETLYGSSTLVSGAGCRVYRATTSSWSVSSTGSVSSVAMSVPSFLSVSGSPITSNGTLAVSYSGTALPIANGGTNLTSLPTVWDVDTYAAWDFEGKLTARTFIPDLEAVATNTLELNSSSGQIQYRNRASASVVQLPPVGDLREGQNFFIINGSDTYDVTVNTNDAVSLQVIEPGCSFIATCRNPAAGVEADGWASTYIPSSVVGGVSSITGTANQVIASSSTGDVTLSLPQDIATSSSVTFAGLNLSGLTASQAIVTDSSKNLASLSYASANTASALVQRDSSGNFSAGTITASLTGHASLDQLLISTPVANNFTYVNGSGQTVDSGLSLSTDGMFASPSNLQVPSTLAVQTFVNNAVSSPITVIGNWDASTNTPTLTAGIGTLNQGYYVSVAGTQTLPSGTSTAYDVGDLIYYGSNLIWNQVQQGTKVVSLNGQSGVISDFGTSDLANVTESSLSDAQVLVYNSGTSAWTNQSFSGAFTINNTGVSTLSTVAIAKGGTGETTASAAFNALSPMTTAGDIIYGGVSGAATRLAAGTGVLVGGSTPSYSTTPTLTGTNFSGIPNSATTATSANTISTIVARDSNGDFSAGNITAAIIGNASTATSLQTARTIGGVSFDGTANIVPQTIQTVDETSDATCFILFGNASGSQSQQPKTNSGLIFNSTTGFLGATGINVSGLTASQAVVTDSSKNLTSLGYASANTVSTLVQRDGSGNFSAGTITAALSGNATTATTLATGRTISITGDLAYTSPSFDGSGNVTAAGTLATVNSNVGSFGSATQVGTFTVNGKGLITAASNTTVTPAVGSITGLGTGVATALAVNVGSAGAFVTLNGALGTPSSGTLTNATGLPISTGVSGLGTGVATFLATPSSANLAAAVTDETGSGALVFGTSPTLTTPNIGAATANSITFATGGADRTSTSNGNTMLLQAYDVDGAAYSTFATFTAGNTPTAAFSQPAGGTLTWDGGAIGATTRANAQFLSPVNPQTGTTYTLAATDCGKLITLNNAAAITLTLPQQSTVTTSAGFWCHVINIGAGTVTIVKEGSESLIGNTTLVTNAECIIERTTTTNWVASYGTAVVNMSAIATINLSITTSNTKDLWCPQANATLLGIRFRAFSVGTAGTFKLQLNGADITGLTGLVPSTTQTYGYATTATNLYAGDVITIVADGTLATIADLNITPIYTVTY